MLDGRKPVLVYQPRHSEQINWLAAVAQKMGVSVFRDEFTLRDNPDELEAVSQSIIDFIPSNDDTHYIGLATARLLTSDGKPLDSEKPAGMLLEPDVPAEPAMLKWASSLAGIGREMKSRSGPVAVVISRDGTQTLQPLPAGFQSPKAPMADKTLIEQIMSNVNRQ